MAEGFDASAGVDFEEEAGEGEEVDTVVVGGSGGGGVDGICGGFSGGGGVGVGGGKGVGGAVVCFADEGVVDIGAFGLSGWCATLFCSDQGFFEEVDVAPTPTVANPRRLVEL